MNPSVRAPNLPAPNTAHKLIFPHFTPLVNGEGVHSQQQKTAISRIHLLLCLKTPLPIPSICAEALSPLRFYESALAVAKAYQESHGVMPSDPTAEVRDLRKQAKARKLAGEVAIEGGGVGGQPDIALPEDDDEVTPPLFRTELIFCLTSTTSLCLQICLLSPRARSIWVSSILDAWAWH